MISDTRVLVCSERFIPRFGADRTLLLFGDQLVSLGYRVTFICLRFDTLLISRHKGDVIVIEIPLGMHHARVEALVSTNVLDKIVPTLTESRVVVVVGGWPFLTLAADSPRHGIPSLFLDAGAVPHENLSFMSKNIQREVRRLRHLTLPHISTIVAVSDFIRVSQSEAERGNKQGVLTARNGGDHLDFSGPDISEPEAEMLDKMRRLSSEGSILLISLGRYETEGYKNSSRAIDVFRIVRRECNKAVLVLMIGDNEISVPDDLVDAALFLPTIGDAALQQVLLICKVGFSVSLWEGFNLPLAEMQRLGRPVFAFNLAAHPEVVIDPWFLCVSSKDMARKILNCVNGQIPRPIAQMLQTPSIQHQHQWVETLRKWTDQIEALAKSNVVAMRTPEFEKGYLIFVDVTNSARDPANSGVIRVTRQLSRRLATVRSNLLVFVAWDSKNWKYRLLDERQRQHLGSFGGPEDWLSRIVCGPGPGDPDGALLNASSIAKGTPVLFLPEVILDGTGESRVEWARNREMRVAFLIHDLLPIYMPELVSKDIVEAFPSYLSAMCSSDAVVANSRSTLAEFNRYIHERNIRRPLECTEISLPGQFSDCIRVRQRPRENEDVLILCVSTVEPRKNHLKLLAGYKLFRERHPEMKLSLALVGNKYAGGESLAEEVTRLVDADDTISWKGALTDPALEELYKHASFAVYPSIAEGFGLPILESLWMGVPCLCHNAGVMSELAASGGCVSVNMHDPEEIAVGLASLAFDHDLIEKLVWQASTRSIRTWDDYSERMSKWLSAASF